MERFKPAGKDKRVLEIMRKSEEANERAFIERTVGMAGYEIIECRTDDRKFDFRIRKNRPRWR